MSVLLLSLAVAGCGKPSHDAPADAAADQSHHAADTAPDSTSEVAVAGPLDKSFSWDPRSQPRDWKYIVLHHTATEVGSVESIHAEHLRRRDADGNPWRGIGYHFVIGNGHGMPDGKIESTFRWREQDVGAHAGTKTHNEAGIGVCLVGDFDRAPPTDAQEEALREILAALQGEFHIPDDRVLRHSHLKATLCPGRFLEWDGEKRKLQHDDSPSSVVSAEE